MASKHIPYEIDESKNRFHYYETLWKVRALELLEKHEPNLKGMSLFDYGCGRGETLKLATELGMIGEGQDMDEECVQRSKQHGDASIMVLEDGLADLPRNHWDVVACFHVLEHVDNPKAVLRSLAASAKKYVLVAVPNLNKLPNIRKPKTVHYNVNEGHLQSWDHAHFWNLATHHCGLELVEWGHDATVVPIISELVKRTLGQERLIKLESGIFRKLFPFWGHSIIGLFKVAGAEK